MQGRVGKVGGGGYFFPNWFKIIRYVPAPSGRVGRVWGMFSPGTKQ